MLTETQIRTAKAKERAFKLFDERSLFMLVTQHGSKLWRFKYSIEGREKLLALGAWPDVSLKMARDRRDVARRQIAEGKDPGAARKAEKAVTTDTFEAIAREFLRKQGERLAGETIALDLARFVSHIFPSLGARPITGIEAPELLIVLQRIEARGTHETARRVRSQCDRVFRYAIATGRAKHNIVADLRGALTVPTVEHFASITDPVQVGGLLRAIDGYQGQPSAMAALKLSPLVFLRPGELRGAEWSEFDLEAAEWRVPAERMKMREQHLVPLSTQAIAILRDLHQHTGHGRLVFPGLRSESRPISDNTINGALRRLGYSGEEQTGHGFRSMASTLLNEQGWHPDLIELQLAHAERNKVRGAYNKAKRLAERRTMMQAWSDYLDGLRAGGNVTPIKHQHQHAT